jgi:hypothetical protein
MDEDGEFLIRVPGCKMGTVALAGVRVEVGWRSSQSDRESPE